MKTRTVRLSDLVLDWSLYPRNEVDSTNRSRLKAAVQSGAVLPPIVVDDKSLRVVDGFHRYHVYRYLYSPEQEIEVIARTYGSEKEMRADAIRSNVVHGKPLSPLDYAYVISKFGGEFSTEEFAEIMQQPEDRIERIITERIGTSPKGEPVVLKRQMRSLAGKKLTAKQMDANEHASGIWSHVAVINQLIRLIESGVLDRTDALVMERLEKLHSLIHEVEARHVS